MSLSLWEIRLKEWPGYDDYYAAIVAASCEHEARAIATRSPDGVGDSCYGPFTNDADATCRLIAMSSIFEVPQVVLSANTGA